MADRRGNPTRGRGRGRGNLDLGGEGRARGHAPGQPIPSTSVKRDPDMTTLKITDETHPVSITGRGGGRVALHTNEPLLITKPESCNTKQGSAGTKVMLKSNYFKLLARPEWTLYQYRVDFSPPEDRTMVRKSLLKDHKSKIPYGYLFDGSSMYTVHHLKQLPLILHSLRQSDNETITITITQVGDVTAGDYAYFQIFNILMRKCYTALNLQMLGRDFFDKQARIDIREHKLQVWPGYRTTIAQYENSILMVAEIIHKVIRLDTVQNLLQQYQGDFGHHNPNYKSAFNKEIIGQIVLTDYNNKTYRVDDVNWNVNPNSTFPMNGTEVTYMDYYQKKYQISIKDYTQPLLVSKAKARDIRRGCSEVVLLIPELCRMTGITDKMRANFTLTRSLATHTRVSPQDRINKLTAFNRRILNTKECIEDLKQWDLQLDNKLVDVPARIFNFETIYQGRGDKYPAGDTNDGWTRNMRSKPLISVAPIRNWAIVCPQRLKRDADNFVKMIIQSGVGMTLNFPAPYFYDVYEDISRYISVLEEIISTMNPTVIVCILSNSNKSDLYSAIKKKCSVDRAIPSQILTGRCLTNKNAMSIATKVAIQINCKVGGSPWSVSIPVEKIMVIGYDVCHDPKNKQNSYGAMVANLDNHCSRFYSCVSQHKNGEELANEFSLNIKKALTKFSQLNNCLPGSIFIYRDGVGDGQLAYVYKHEVELIKKALSDVYASNPIKMAFIVVSKRLNTRFFYNGANPKPGTVIDDVVTLPQRFDFYLISQAVRDGTVAPTSYNVLYNSSGLDADKIQRLSYKLCHMYFNFAGQVRVPAHCQYAHKLAFLSSQNLQNSPNEALHDLLHFL